jgi:hypothetical protein
MTQVMMQCLLKYILVADIEIFLSTCITDIIKLNVINLIGDIYLYLYNNKNHKNGCLTHVDEHYIMNIQILMAFFVITYL